MKTCSRCNQTKSLDEFTKSKVSSDGYSAWCKECHKQYVKDSRGKNKNREIIDIIHTAKKCPKCNQIKPIKQFYKSKSVREGKQSLCKECIKIHMKEVKRNNRLMNQNVIEDDINKTKRCTKCKVLKPVSAFTRRLDTRSGYNSYCKECNNKYGKSEARRKVTTDYHVKYVRKRRAIDPMFKLSSNFSKMIRNSILSGKNSRHWEKVVGYTLLKLVEHLEKQFLPFMSWNNYGKWHIDHIIPISYFKFYTTEDPDFKKCWALKNLRPLWAIDNIRKGGRIEDPNHLKLILDNEE